MITLLFQFFRICKFTFPFATGFIGGFITSVAILSLIWMYLPEIVVFIYYTDMSEEEAMKESTETIWKTLADSLLFVTLNVSFFIILSSWVRAAGPRTRVDFLSDVTWKKIIIFIVLAVSFGIVNW